MKNLRFLIVALLAAGAAVSARAADAPNFDVELGYRFTDIKGNEDMYRSQINEREGFLLRAFTLSAGGPVGTGLFDQLRLDASDLGVGPAGAFRLQAGRAGKYDLRVTY